MPIRLTAILRFGLIFDSLYPPNIVDDSQIWDIKFDVYELEGERIRDTQDKEFLCSMCALGTVGLDVSRDSNPLRVGKEEKSE